MRKGNLMIGFLYVLVGVVCLLTAVFTETSLDGMFWGFAGAGIVPGVSMIVRYFYWTSSHNAERYQERMETAYIEEHDELKEKLRDKAGRYAYTVGMIAISMSILVFSILGSLDIVENGRLVILFLGGYLVFQVLVDIVIFYKLSKKY